MGTFKDFERSSKIVSAAELAQAAMKNYNDEVVSNLEKFNIGDFHD